MRLFIALNFPQRALDYLQRAQKSLDEVALEGRMVTREKLHLTLAFLGELSLHDTPLLIEILKEIKGGPFTLSLEQLGTFNRGLWWVGVKENLPLKAYREALCARLTEGGFHLDRHPFRPHITIARRVTVNAKPTFDEACTFSANQVTLMESDFKNYREVFSKELR